MLEQEMQVCNSTTFASSPTPGVEFLARGSGFSAHLALAFTLVGVFGGILAVGCMLLVAMRCQSNRKQVSVFVDVDVYDAASPLGTFHVPVRSFQEGLESSLKVLTYSDLVLATDNFSAANIIGDGGFGMVYKAKLTDGTVVAIKKLLQVQNTKMTIYILVCDPGSNDPWSWFCPG